MENLEKLWLGMRAIITEKLAEKFAKVEVEHERDSLLRAWEVVVHGTNLGKVTEVAQYPTEWERFLKRKDCPEYLKKLTTLNIEEHYPKLAIPEEDHWVTFRERN